MILSLENELVRESPSAWWELHSSIMGKDRAAGPITAPNLIANQMQAEYVAIWKQCCADGIPCRIVGLKGRQQGSSTIGVAILYWIARSRNSRTMIVGDEYEKSVKNLKAMFDYYALSDRFDWGNSYNPSSGVFSHGSLFETDTANDPRAGASGTIQAALLTEVAHWKETGKISAKQTFGAFFECVPNLPETFILVESTPKGASGAYFDTYQKAISLAEYRRRMDAGEPMPTWWNGFFKVFYAWWQHPEYTRQADAAMAAEIMGSLTDNEQELLSEDPSIDVHRLYWRRTKIATPAFNGDEEKFEQEYPRNERSGFLTSGRRAFPMKAIQQMRKLVKEPHYGTLEWSNPQRTKAVFRPTSEDEAMVKVWEMPRPGYGYWFPLDPAKGASQTVGADPDNHAPGVLRQGNFDGGTWEPPMLVARLANCFEEKRQKKISCRWAMDVLADFTARLAAYYGNCQVVPEVNQDSGLTQQLHNMGVDVYVRTEFNRLEQKTTNQIGWRTDEANRRFCLEMLATAIRKHDQQGEGVLIQDPLVLDELDTCIINQTGKVEAMSGSHDDTVLMIGIGLATSGVAKRFLPEDRFRLKQTPTGPEDSTYSA